MKELLQLSRASFEMFSVVQKRLVKALRTNELIRDRVQRLMTIQGIGVVTALTWALEIGDPLRFASIRQAISYCGCAVRNGNQPARKNEDRFLRSAIIRIELS
ncbi:MAG: transposase [Desulfobulbus sp.]